MSFPILQKPPYHQPCNRCGYCCDVAPCTFARVLLYQFHGRCQALEIAQDGTTACGLVARPFHYFSPNHPELRRDAPRTQSELSAEIARSLGIGTNHSRCDSFDPGVVVMECSDGDIDWTEHLAGLNRLIHEKGAA